MKRFIALARVSSREQEREGFSLDVQEDAFQEYAGKNNGTLVEVFRIAETATKADERKVFNEVIQFAKKHHQSLDGILFYKVDRAARNLKDFVLLEELETDFGIDFISITQPTQNTPAGRMMRRQLATIASYTTEQQSLDVREGIAKRVERGLPPSRAPFGYRNVRKNGRSVVEVHPENGFKVQEIFRLYAYQGVSVEAIREKLFGDGMFYAASKPKFSTTKLYAVLHDRHYIGEIKHRGKWHPGAQEPLIDEATWSRVQVLLGKKVYRSHEMLFAGGLISCGHCGRSISAEVKEKRTKVGLKRYTYYRCARYTGDGHPRLRLSESDIDRQVVTLFQVLHERCGPIRSWIAEVDKARRSADLQAGQQKLRELKRQSSRVAGQQEELLELRLSGKITDDRFESKQSELEQRLDLLAEQIAVQSSGKVFAGDGAFDAGNLFRLIVDRWADAGFHAKRRILEIVFSTLTLHGEAVVTDNGTPFEQLLAQ